MPGMWWVLAAVAVAALLSAYLGWTAQRVERVHARAQSAKRALEAHLLRRAAAAAVVAEHAALSAGAPPAGPARSGADPVRAGAAHDPGYVAELYAAARLALDAEPDEREAAENGLTRQLQALPLATFPLTAADPAMRTLIATSRRAVVARQVHTDLVRDALTARGRPLVRLLGMARRYPRPTYFDIVEPTLPDFPAAPAADVRPEPAVVVDA
jgi:hypothetical protein